jgi:RHS repeat-associated protein
MAVQQGGVYWVHQDPLVKSKRVTNSSGTVVNTVELDPWGGNTNRSSTDAFQPHKFNNYERDINQSDEAMFRRYNRWWSRFDQPDPYDGSYNLADPQSLNRYAYVQNDPVNLIDPTGLLPNLCLDIWTGDGASTQCFGPYLPWPGFVPKENPVPNTTSDPTPTPTAATEDRLPFNTCDEFVNWLSELTTQSEILMGVRHSNVNFSAKGFGTALAATAYYGYEKHIHNDFEGFKGELVNAGDGTKEGKQGAGVYGHILFSSGAELVAKAGFAEGAAAYHANRLKDWGQALFGSSQYQSERAGNIAGKAVGDQLWKFFGGKMSQSELINGLRGILCE